jgi:hypothetical protein
MIKKKRIIVKEGDICKIPLDDGCYSYCMKIDRGEYAFFNHKSSIDITIDEIIKKDILFIVGVSRHTPRDGNWVKIGKDKEFSQSIEVPNSFTYDKHAKINKFSIYITEIGELRSSSLEEIKDLEMTASWDYHHIKDRLRDSYLGVECIWMRMENEIKNEVENSIFR